MNKREVGAACEKRAALYAQEAGINILEANFRCRLGEIDLIGREGRTLVFIEVKYRRDARAGLPEEAVTLRKQRTICRVADFYRLRHGIGADTPVRYDVAAIEGGQIRWYRDAFAHIGSW